MSQSVGLLILGMHRSGTSLLTRLTNLLGAEIGSNLMEAAEGNNETGFWEHQTVVDVHDEIFNALGFFWDDFRSVPRGIEANPLLSPHRGDLSKVIADDFAPAPLWVLKDPRLCRLMPLWTELLGKSPAIEAKAIIALRNPQEVARSLEKRDGFPLAKGYLLWLRHMLEAEYHSRGLERSWVQFDDLMADWAAAADRIASDLSLIWPNAPGDISEDVATFIRPKLRHHQTKDADFLADASVPALIRDAHRIFLSLAEDDSEAHRGEMDKVRARLDEAAGLFEDSVGDAVSIINGLRVKAQDLDRAVAERDSRIQERDSRIQDRETRLHEARLDIGNLLETVENYRRKVEDVSRSIDAEREQMEEERKGFQKELNAIYRSTSWQISYPVRAARPLTSIPRALIAGIRQIGKSIVDQTKRAHFYIKQFRTEYHELEVSPDYQTGLDVVPAEGFRVQKIGGIFHIHMKSGPDDLMNHAFHGLVELECEVKEGAVRAWFYNAQEGEKFVETAVYIPLTEGRGKLLMTPSKGITALRIEPIGEDALISEPKVRVTEMGQIPYSKACLAEWQAMGESNFEVPEDWKIWLSKRTRERIHERQVTRIGRGEYSDWIAKFDTRDEADKQTAVARIGEMPLKPKFSIVMPTYNSPEIWLRKALDSVLDQWYENWEFCIADDASTKTHVRAILEEYQAKDPRFKVCFREKNGHISAASNSALELADGDFIVLLDHDDELPEHALYVVAETINEQPDLDLIFSDEDKIDEQGQRFDPYFKSDFNLDLFLSHNMVSHLGVYRRAKLEEIGGFREGYEGSQDYDLALRVVQSTDLSKIKHIPQILYYWRAIPGSVAVSGDQKEYAHAIARKAIQSFLDHIGRSGAKAVSTYNGTIHRIDEAIPYPEPKVTIIIPTKDKLDLLEQAVDGVLNETDYPNYDLIVVDNQSEEEETKNYLRHLDNNDRVTVLEYDLPYNFAAINNVAAKQASGDILCFLNNDVEITESDWLEQMVGQALRDDVGAVGAKLLYPDGTIQHGGVVLTPYYGAWHAHTGLPDGSTGYVGRALLQQNFSAVTAACMVIRKDRFWEVDGFDAENFGIAFNDIDLCLRLGEKGYRNVWRPFAEMIHHESVSLGDPKNADRITTFKAESDAFKLRWKSVIANDPCYSPNLTELNTHFGLAFPPRHQPTFGARAKSVKAAE